MIHTVIFDVGGTLVCSEDIFEKIAEELDNTRIHDISVFLKNRFLEIYRDENREFMNVCLIFSVIIEEATKKFATKEFRNDVNQFYKETFIDNSRLFDGTIETLNKLRERKLRLVVASDADTEVLMKELEHFRIKEYFDEIIISENVGAYKPSDKMVKEIMKVCRKPYSEVLFVGDTEADIITAQKMHTKSVLINRSGRFSGNPDFKISNLAQILEILG